MAKIYERNPDTGEVRERERVEPAPYRNEAAEALEILARMERKIDALLEEMDKKNE